MQVSPPIQHWPRYFSPALADQWLSLSLALPWQQHQIQMFGQKLPVPRLELFFGDSPTCRYVYSGSVELVAHPWPEFLRDMRSQIEAKTGYRYQVVMGNLYRDGRDSNGYHADDEQELGENPAIASVSLGYPRNFRLKPRQKGLSSVALFLGHGDLLLMRPGCQRDWLHTVPKTKRPCTARVNWTFRPHCSTIC